MSALIITYNGKTATLEDGQTATLRCAGKPMTYGFAIVFNSVGYFTYNGVTTVGRAGKSSGLNCAGKIMLTDIVIKAGEYGIEDSPLPIEVATEAEMNALLTNATSDHVGSVYKYTGETTDTFEKGELYIIEEESES